MEDGSCDFRGQLRKEDKTLLKRLIPLVLATMAFCLFASAIQASATYRYQLTIDENVIKVSQSKSFILQVGVKKFVNQKEGTALKVGKLELRFNRLPNEVMEIFKGNDYVDIHVQPAGTQIPKTKKHGTIVAGRKVSCGEMDGAYYYSCYVKTKLHVYLIMTDVAKKQKDLPRLFRAAVISFKEVKLR